MVDGGGLYFEVLVKGFKYWCMKYRCFFDKKEDCFVFGVWFIVMFV